MKYLSGDNNNFLFVFFNYSRSSLTVKFFIFIRLLTGAFFDLIKILPSGQSLLDIGCGHGVFSVLLTKENKYSKIVGIDPDKSKINEAKKVSLQKVSFSSKSVDKLVSEKQKFDVVTIIDVVYLINDDNLKKFLLTTKKLLPKNNGFIVIKTSPKENSLGHYFAKLQEKIMVQLFKKTHSESSILYFRTLEEYKNLFLQCGYTITEEKRLKTLFFHPHYVFILKKSTAT